VAGAFHAPNHSTCGLRPNQRQNQHHRIGKQQQAFGQVLAGGGEQVLADD